MSHNVFLFLLLLVVIFHLAHADFEFTTSYPQECTPLNITWKPDWSAFPYSVYFMVIGAQVQSWQIKSDYQPNAQEITFQYVLPKLGQPFQSFMVAVVDSKGNGNSSQVLVPKSLDKHPSNCSDFAGTNGWTFASDLKSANGGPNNQDRLQCEVLSYYAVEQFTGSGPFSYSLVPTQGTPITVNVPKSAQTGSSHFYYESILPLKQGTTFFQFMSDALSSGDGGGSPLYTVGPSQNDSCLQSNFKLKDLDTTHALPVGSNLASFQNLPGAIASPLEDGGNNVTSNTVKNTTSGSQNYGEKHLGGVLGGVLGALFVLLLLAFIIFRVRRKLQKKQQQSHRMESAQFVDLGESVLEHGPSSIRQSTLISPFLHASDGAVHGEIPNDERQNVIGLAPIGHSEISSALSTSFGERSDTGLRRVPPSSTVTRSGSDYGLSLANYTSDASEALLDLANDSGNQSGSLQHGRHQSQGSNANESMRFRSGSMYSSTGNPISINGVLAENEMSSAEANMSSMHDFSPMSNNTVQPAGVINRETRIRASSTLIRMSNESVQTQPESRYIEQFDAGPLMEDSPPPYKFRVDQANSPKP